VLVFFYLWSFVWFGASPHALYPWRGGILYFWFAFWSFFNLSSFVLHLPPFMYPVRPVLVFCIFSSLLGLPPTHISYPRPVKLGLLLLYLGAFFALFFCLLSGSPRDPDMSVPSPWGLFSCKFTFFWWRPGCHFPFQFFKRRIAFCFRFSLFWGLRSFFITFSPLSETLFALCIPAVARFVFFFPISWVQIGRCLFF